MPLSVTDLKPGDRVVLNCPSARGQQKREGVFEGVFNSIGEAMDNQQSPIQSVLIQRDTEEFMQTAGHWALFLLMKAPAGAPRLTMPGGDTIELPPSPLPTELRAAFLVEPDGALREEQGKRITIERRIRMGQG